jgi:predicted secreted hydrolase
MRVYVILVKGQCDMGGHLFTQVWAVCRTLEMAQRAIAGRKEAYRAEAIEAATSDAPWDWPGHGKREPDWRIEQWPVTDNLDDASSGLGQEMPTQPMEKQ